MSQELSDAEWLRLTIAYYEQSPESIGGGGPHFLARLRSIADRLERPAVAGWYNDCGGYGSQVHVDFEKLTAMLGREPAEGERFTVTPFIAPVPPKPATERDTIIGHFNDVLRDAGSSWRVG